MVDQSKTCPPLGCVKVQVTKCYYKCVWGGGSGSVEMRTRTTQKQVITVFLKILSVYEMVTIVKTHK